MSTLGLMPPLAPVIPSVVGRLTSASQKIADGTATQKDLDEFMLFSPFALEDVDQELVMLGAAAVGLFLSKTDRGMKLLEKLVENYFKTISSIIGSMAKGASTNVISSLNSQLITVRMARRLGLITNAEANVIHHETVNAMMRLYSEAIIGQITHAVGTVFGGAGRAAVVLTRPAAGSAAGE